MRYCTHRKCLLACDADDFEHRHRRWSGGIFRGLVVGFLGRDVAGLTHRPKYLNSAQSATYDKASLLYRATRRDRRTPLVVVEGALDALAVDALAAHLGNELRAVSPSGTALTAPQQAVVAAESAGPPVLCPDGDQAGRRAALSWVMEMTVAGREVLG